MLNPPLEPDFVVTSPRNPRVRAVARLRKRREREQTRLLLVEGAWPLRLALQAGMTPAEVYVCPALALPEAWEVVAESRRRGARIIELGLEVAHRLSYRDGPDGLLAIIPAAAPALDDVRLGPAPLVVVVEAVEKPGNLGAIVRTACAARADAVISCDPMTDPFGPGVIRASLGTIFLVPVVVVPTDEALPWLRARGVRVLAATPEGAVCHWEADLRRPVAVALGNEHRGLSGAWRREADERVAIPMPGSVNSLNVTTAAGIILFEALRQRRSLLSDGRILGPRGESS